MLTQDDRYINLQKPKTQYSNSCISNQPDCIRRLPWFNFGWIMASNNNWWLACHKLYDGYNKKTILSLKLFDPLSMCPSLHDGD